MYRSASTRPGARTFCIRRADLHSASRAHNLLKHAPGLDRLTGSIGACIRPRIATRFARLERRQYLTPPTPIILAISGMVRGHFRQYLGLPESAVRVLHAAIDPDRFAADDRPARRQRERHCWGVAADEPVGLFVGMNYRLKGLAPLFACARARAGGLPISPGRCRRGKVRALRVAGPATRRSRSRPLSRLSGRPARRLLRRRLPGASDLLRSRARSSRWKRSRAGCRW